jgi:Spy/CpxP family protein refolding chaperone
MSAVPLRRARALSAALLLAVFTAGFLAGAAVDRALADRDDRPHKKWRGPRGMEAEVLERLDLDAGQREQMETIFERRREEAAAVWKEVKPRLNEVVAGTRDDLSRVLTPEQLEEYDRLMAERWKTMDNRFEAPKRGDT